MEPIEVTEGGKMFCFLENVDMTENTIEWEDHSGKNLKNEVNIEKHNDTAFVIAIGPERAQRVRLIEPVL